MNEQRKKTHDLVDGLRKIASDRPDTRRLAKKALANFQELQEEAFADLFVVLIVEDTLFVRSTRIYMPSHRVAFCKDVSEWARVELMWWCDDQDKAVDEKGALVESGMPGLYHIDVSKGRMASVEQGAIYQASRKSLARLDKQFALISEENSSEAVWRALRHRFTEVHGLVLPLEWVSSAEKN